MLVKIVQATAALALALAATAAPAPAQAGPQWVPAEFAAADTIELRTISSEEGEYWFPVWVVVLDDAVYVRLGSRAAERIKFNTAFPDIGVRLGDKQFDRVHAQPAADYAVRVAGAMADKYWTDLFIRWLDHPLTLELVPAKVAAVAPAAAPAAEPAAAEAPAAVPAEAPTVPAAPAQP